MEVRIEISAVYFNGGPVCFMLYVKTVDEHKINLQKQMGCAKGIVGVRNKLELQLTVLLSKRKSGSPALMDRFANIASIPAASNLIHALFNSIY